MNLRTYEPYSDLWAVTDSKLLGGVDRDEEFPISVRVAMCPAERDRDPSGCRASVHVAGSTDAGSAAAASTGAGFFPISAPGMGRFQLLNLEGLGYGLELRFWVVIAIIVSLTLTITLITTLTII